MRRVSPLLAVCLFACDTSTPEPSDARDDDFGSFGKADGAPTAAEIDAILVTVNLASIDALDDDARLDARAAKGIVAHRRGPDGIDGTADDDPFDDLPELDAVPWVGPVALSALREYVHALGLVAPTNACLVISEYLEGAMAYNKGIELYNCGDDSLPLSEYALCLVRNDDTDCTATAAFADVVLAPGDVWTVCRSQRTHTSDPYPSLVARCDEELGSVMIYSGDDRMVVLHDPAGGGSIAESTVMDALGRIAFRPTWNPWADVGMRRCTAQPNLGLEFYDEDDWFSKHTRHDFTDFGVAPTFDCE